MFRTIKKSKQKQINLIYFVILTISSPNYLVLDLREFSLELEFKYIYCLIILTRIWVFNKIRNLCIAFLCTYTSCVYKIQTFWIGRFTSAFSQNVLVLWRFNTMSNEIKWVQNCHCSFSTTLVLPLYKMYLLFLNIYWCFTQFWIKLESKWSILTMKGCSKLLESLTRVSSPMTTFFYGLHTYYMDWTISRLSLFLSVNAFGFWILNLSNKLAILLTKNCCW